MAEHKDLTIFAVPRQAELALNLRTMAISSRHGSNIAEVRYALSNQLSEAADCTFIAARSFALRT